MPMRSAVGMVVSLTLLSLLVAACGGAVSDASGLPTMRPTVTALPPSTPTDVPAPPAVNLPPVDWQEVEHFRAAMRPAFAGDIDDFVDRNRYYIRAALSFEDGAAIIQGAQRVRYTNHSADTLQEIVFRLYPNLPALGGRMVVHAAELNGAPVAPVLAERDSVLVIPLDAPLRPGQSAEMALQFSVAAERGMNASYGAFGFQRSVFSGPEWYPLLSVYEEGAGWWLEQAVPAGDAVYSETGLYEIFLTVPDNFVVALSGSEIDRFASSEQQVTHHYVSGPMRDSLLVAGPHFGRLQGEADGIAVNVYYWPGGEAAAEQVLTITENALRIFNEAFGPYPFAELDVAQTFNYSAIEYPGIIIVADRVWERGNQFLEIATAHEVGHQWFYSLVGNDQVGQPWIDESLTSFTEYVYLRGVYGDDRLKDTIQGDRDLYNYYKSTGAPDLTLNLPVAAYTDNNYGVIIYTKGPLFYAELERMLGTERLLAALRLYVERHRYEIAHAQDVLAAFEDATGEELDALFYRWVGAFEGLDPAVMGQAEGP